MTQRDQSNTRRRYLDDPGALHQAVAQVIAAAVLDEGSDFFLADLIQCLRSERCAEDDPPLGIEVAIELLERRRFE